MTLTTIGIKSQTGSTVLDSTNNVAAQYREVVLPQSAGSVTPSSLYVGEYSTLSVKLKIGNAIPSTGKIIVYLPKWESVSLGAIIPGSMVTGVTSCTAGSDISSGSPICTPTINSDPTGRDKIEITNAFIASNGLLSGKTLEIKVNNVRNPPTLKPSTLFDIYTTDSLGNLIETCFSLTLSLSHPGSLSSGSYLRVTGNSGIN